MTKEHPGDTELLLREYNRIEIRRQSYVAIVFRRHAVLVDIKDARTLATEILDLIK